MSTKNSQHEPNWFKKLKALLFGEKKILILAQEKPILISSDTEMPEKLLSNIEAWIKALDVLQPLVVTRRKELEPDSEERFNLELLGASTYLFHVDRLVVKMREHFLTLRYRRDQFARQPEVLKKAEFVQTQQICEQTYLTILNITALLQKLPNKRLYSDEFISMIHAFELETASVGSSIRVLNQFAYRQEAYIEIAALEETLRNSFSNNNQLTKASSHEMRTYSPYSGTSEYLRGKVKHISFPAHEEFLIRLVDIYDMLKKCYVVVRKSVIKDTLDQMGESIEQLIVIFQEKEISQQDAFLHLHEIYNSLESLRFSTNRESRCSRNLFEKARIARHLLRKACISNALGQEFLKEISVRKTMDFKK
jgi:hypothetical protein